MDWAELIKQVGFPVAVTLYVLIRLEKAMKDVTDKTILLSEKLVALDTYIRTKLESMGG